MHAVNCFSESVCTIEILSSKQKTLLSGCIANICRSTVYCHIALVCLGGGFHDHRHAWYTINSHYRVLIRGWSLVSQIQRILSGFSAYPTCYSSQLYVEMILKQLHKDSGHLAVYRTTEKVKERFYWPGYEADIERWVKDQECQQCQKHNPPQPQPRAPLSLIKCGYPFDVISWDIMGPLPTSTKGNKYILVVTDLFSKWVEAFPLVATDSETLASVLVDEVVCRYGVPRVLHSDQGANLNSQVIVSGIV